MAEPAPALETPVYSARPRLELGGAEDAMAGNLLQQMEMREAEGGLSSLELRFSNSAEIDGGGQDYAFETDSNTKLSLGEAIRVVAGPFDDPQEIFQGTISALELVIAEGEGPQLIVLAEDKLQSARLARRTKLHPAGTLRDIAQAVATDLGITLGTADLDLQVEPQLQLNETDLGFLRRLLARYDADLQIVGDSLEIASRENVDRGLVTLAVGETLVGFRAVADLADQVTGVSFAGWDPAAGQAIEVENDTTAFLGPGAGRKGADILNETFGARIEHCGEAAAANEAEAQALANSLYASRARRFVSIHGAALGDPRIRVGTLVEIAGAGPRFDNTYFVAQAVHCFDLENGYQTEFRAESAFFGG